VNEEARTAAAVFAGLPPIWPHGVLARNRRAAAGSTLVVVDDEPTLRAKLCGAPTCFFILTNSRSLDASASLQLHRELAGSLLAAATAGELGPFDATFLVPYFEAGGRCTLDDIHYVLEGERLVPAADTPFARDPAFGYSTSHLPSWVEEKTGGRIAAERRGARFLYRTAAGFVAARLGQRPHSLLAADALRVPSAHGGLVGELRGA